MACGVLLHGRMKMIVVGTAVVAMAVVSPAAAETPPSAATTTTTSYRVWTLGADGASVAIGLGSLALHRGSNQREVLEYGSLVGLGLGAPLIHALRGHETRALTSVGIRIGFTGVGAALGAAVSGCGATQGPSCDPATVAGGAAVGMLVAIAVDAVYLTDERSAAPTWAPRVAIGDGGAQLGLATAF